MAIPPSASGGGNSNPCDIEALFTDRDARLLKLAQAVGPQQAAQPAPHPAMGHPCVTMGLMVVSCVALAVAIAQGVRIGALERRLDAIIAGKAANDAKYVDTL